jgi:hypothetical protein
MNKEKSNKEIDKIKTTLSLQVPHNLHLKVKILIMQQAELIIVGHS